MPALLDIRRRIRSVKNTQQITKAMKMVSAAKLRRATEAVFAARPYSRKMVDVLNSLASRADPTLHPLLWERGQERQLLVVITSDKGLCGGFNSNILRQAVRVLEEQERQGRQPVVEVVGRKAREFFRRRKWALRAEHVGVFAPLNYNFAQGLARTLIQAFVGNEVDQIHLLYNEFKSVIQQRVVVEQLLPIPRLSLDAQDTAVDYLYQPDPERIFESLLPKHVEIQVWRALLESQAAEHGARMTAMDAATNNAGEMIDKLTLYMNKVRQAAITKEIIEVVSGAGSPS
jgi:F-type H+-transporting ATPase subunit gamma